MNCLGLFYSYFSNILDLKLIASSAFSIYNTEFNAALSAEHGLRPAHFDILYFHFHTFFQYFLISKYFLTSLETSSLTQGLWRRVWFGFEVFGAFHVLTSLSTPGLIPLELGNIHRVISAPFNS